MVGTTLCATGVLFEDIELVNYGANPINSIEVQFFIREGTSSENDMKHGAVRTIDFSPALASQARSTLFEEGTGVTIPIPEDLYDGRVFLRIMTVNGVVDTEDELWQEHIYIFVDRERVENELHALEFELRFGWGTISTGSHWHHIEVRSVSVTGSKGNNLLRINRVLERCGRWTLHSASYESLYECE